MMRVHVAAGTALLALACAFGGEEDAVRPQLVDAEALTPRAVEQPPLPRSVLAALQRPPPPRPPSRRRRPEAVRAAAPAGTIVAHGGGALGPATKQRFARLCRDEKLVVIPTASPRSDRRNIGARLRAQWLPYAFDEVAIMHARRRAEAMRDGFANELRDAGCVWLGGGVQGRLIRRYVGTPVEEELHAVLQRGGVIGGYSAGTAILSEVMIRHGNPRPAEGHGFGLLRGIVVDQHFIAHERERRLRTMLARHPDLVGYGVDEGTALVVEGPHYEVIGHSVVRRCTHDEGCRDLLPGAAGEFP